MAEPSRETAPGTDPGTSPGAAPRSGAIEVVDARGLSCPQPVILARKALLGADGGRVVVLVDTMTQVYNCSRAAARLGWTATCEERAGSFELTLQR